MNLQRLRCEWSGSGVDGPGVTTFYGEATGTLEVQVGAAAFFAALDGMIPTGTSITIPQGGDLIDEETGALVGVWGGATPTTLNCSGSGGWAAGVGARVRWQTGAVRAGRRVTGSTFVVPLTTFEYDSNGTLTSLAVDALETAVAAMLTQAPTELRVWSRPRPGLAGAGVPVTSGDVPDRVSWLRSRRT